MPGGNELVFNQLPDRFTGTACPPDRFERMAIPRLTVRTIVDKSMTSTIDHAALRAVDAPAGGRGLESQDGEPFAVGDGARKRSPTSAPCTRLPAQELLNPLKESEVKLPCVTQNDMPTVASFRTWRG